MLVNAISREPSYPEVGRSLGESLPADYISVSKNKIIGLPANFEQLVSRVLHWEAQTESGVKIFPADSEAVFGSTTLLVLNLGPIQMIAPCRVVSVLQEPDRRGFAYGTLPGHPECGEQSIVIERHPEYLIVKLSSFSRPASPLARISGSLGRRVQSVFSERYVNALCGK
jgi:uncharacterized protein (UPF0548 family)